MADDPFPPALPERLRLLTAVALALLLTACAGVPPQVQRVPSRAVAAGPDAPLATMAREAGIPAGATGVWPLAQGAFAIDARLALIENATTSLDLQYYLIGDDATGHQILRALRDAALRGVRVRLLVDDMYTAGLDPVLLGLAATPNVEVRLFNPFITDRESSMRRLLALFLDFRRLNHRMHNKLFVADGAAAVVGGRNLADEYFLRGTLGNFIDFDLLVTGAIAPQLGDWFDLYWNSEQVYPLGDVVRASGAPAYDAASLRSAFEAATLPERPEPPVPATDFFGAVPLHEQFARHRFRFLAAETTAFADSPDKIDPDHHSIATHDTLAHRFLNALDGAHEDVLLISPYFVPGDRLLERFRELRRAGVRIRVFTNSLAVSDEPLVSLGFERHQRQLLELGVELYEFSSTRLKLDTTLRNLLGNSTGRLHAKIGFIDKRTLLVGSMNLDPRSSMINTEIGMAVRSPELAAMVSSGFRIDSLVGVYRVRLKADGSGVRWTATNPDSADPEADVEIDTDPDTTLWQRLQLLLLSTFVPESQL